jgi:hypothetical protein
MTDLSACFGPPASSDGMDAIFDPAVNAAADEYRSRFQRAEPFKHVVVEPFFAAAMAEQLVADFPPFSNERAINEFGVVGGKAVNEKLAAISPAYARLAGHLQSAQFLQLISHLTGIPDLLADPNMHGGGTHENRHGQELDPHVDFNYDPPTKLHRRINLLVYLNKEWRAEWGGSIELHSNPRRPEDNRITSYAPAFNRALIFETNEYSWHGFPKIDLPAEKRHLSRKSISIYLYSRDRPASEIGPEHGTFYVQRALPERIRPGHVLTAADVAEIESLLRRRDHWIERYQRFEVKVSGEMGGLNERIRTLEHLLTEARTSADRPIAARRETGRALFRRLRYEIVRLLGVRRQP